MITTVAAACPAPSPRPRPSSSRKPVAPTGPGRLSYCPSQREMWDHFAPQVIWLARSLKVNEGDALGCAGLVSRRLRSLR